MPKENLTPNNLNDFDDNNKQWMKREKKVHKPNLFRQATAGEHQMIYYLFIEITILPKKKTFGISEVHAPYTHSCMQR